MIIAGAASDHGNEGLLALTLLLHVSIGEEGRSDGIC
jgi:hypothetical protein